MSVYLTTFFIAMVPVLELRGAIPLGVAGGLDPWIAMAVAVAGNLIPVPFIVVFIRKFFKWLRTKSAGLEKFVERLEKKAEGKKEQVLKYEFWGLLLLVAIPLPGTGAWTGSLVAAMLDMQLKRAVPSIVLGVIIAGVIVTLATMGVVAII